MYFKLFFLIVISQALSASSDTLSLRKDFDHYFNEFNTSGSILIYDQNNNRWITNDTSEIKKETLPASTFKIINMLIALETGVIKDETEIVKWTGDSDTSLYGYRPDIYRDMSVQEAFQKSAVWVFIELARRIGKESYANYLRASGYGNNNLSEPGYDFWNFGSFGISPLDQVKFLINLYKDNLPFSKTNMETVKRVMVNERNDNYTLRAKTGWTSVNGNNIGWWVGYVDSNNGLYFFATRITQNKSLYKSTFAQSRKDITRAILRDLEIIP